MTHTPHFIDGRWTNGSGADFASTNPATLEEVWRGKAAGHNEIDHAVQAARMAFPAWSALGFDARREKLERFRDLIEADKEALTEALSQETGKALWDASAEIAAMIGKLPVCVQAYQERTGEKKGTGAGFKTALHHRPHGVVAVYGPYNFPAHLPNGHIMPALLAGNTVIFKPSELTPRIAQRVMEHWEKAGLPNGVINLVQGERETGKYLAAHDGIDGLFFTGSSDTGAILAKQFAETPHKVLALELGGNNPMIVHDVKNLDAVVFNIIQSAFMSTGQRCSCTRRLILTAGPWQETLLGKLVATAKSLRAGAYTDTPEPYMGPITSGREVEKLLTAQQALIAGGAIPLLEMTRPDTEKWFLTAGILDVTAMAERPDREYFGPLLQVIRVADFDAAIHEANNTQFGLTAGVLSDSQAFFDRAMNEIHAGVVNWNRPTTGASATAPFGGLGKSGNHRPSAYYAADYCAHPLASTYSETLEVPATLPPGVTLA